MREIKFRAWNKNTNEWVLPYYPELIEDRYCQWLPSHNPDIELMQYTGLKDDNGVEIYEGDVVYLAGYGNYEVDFPFTELYEAVAEGDVEGIIGNIYESPNLLEQGN